MAIGIILMTAYHYFSILDNFFMISWKTEEFAICLFWYNVRQTRYLLI